jgi:hypothetical protein
MPHTFDIRFARSAGLASLLAAPENPFRWKGGGRLSIDGQRVSIVVKRGLATLFSGKLTRHIEADDLAEVYREGDARRVEFNTAGAQRVVMPFWARDRAAAAEIVRLMPTRRTIEIDEALVGTRRRFRVDVPLVACLVGAVALLVIATLATVGFRPAALPVATRAAVPEPALGPAKKLPAIPVDVGARPRPGIDAALPEAALPQVVSDGVFAIMPGDPVYAEARRLADRFDAASSRLSEEYLYERAPKREIEEHWWILTQSLIETRESADKDLRPLIDAELSASQSWRGALWVYEEGRRRDDGVLLEQAIAEFENARRLTDRAKLYVY